ncbi:MAG: peptidase [Alphaproteobacteria bacterium]|jgi:putative iron-regulated protein|nr:peptidase [Alphaproteobacteria bacterium]
MAFNARTATAAAVLPLALGVASPAAAQPQAEAVVTTYADIAHAMYEDSLTAARALDTALQTLVAEPSPASLAAAREAWLAARVPYQQTEVYRFGNPIVDDWEGRVNAWPLDEGLIDYVDTGRYGDISDMNRLYTANVIAHADLTFGGRTIDASSITPALLSEELHEADNIEANVATGYHAIEFLLWGQDLNGTGPGAGNRPYTDFDTADCTGGNCERRIEYLTAASELLIDDLEEMVANWAEGGAARAAVTDDPQAGLSAIVTGLGSLSYGELAGERTQLGLMLHDPEEEHDCFADNTHNSHYFNQVGMLAVYGGAYQRIDGSTVAGPALAEMVEAADPALAESVDRHMGVTLGAMEAMVAAAENGMAFDQMLGEGNAVGNAILQSVVDSLVAQAGTFESVVATLDLEIGAFEGSDSLDDPNAVFQ